MAGPLNIVYFAWVKERLGRGEEQIIVSDATQNVAQLISQLIEKDPSYRDVFEDLGKLRFALDQNFVPIEAPIGAAKELAIFPPVTGG